MVLWSVWSWTECTIQHLPNPDKPEKNKLQHAAQAPALRVTEIQNSKKALVIGIWDFFVIWIFDIGI